MDIFGIGPTELVFIILIALILLGPKEMDKTGRTIGRFLRDITKSDGWRAFRDTPREIRNIPTRLMREANFEDLQKDIGKIGKDIEESTKVEGFGAWTNPAASKSKVPHSKPQPAEVKEKSSTSPDTVPLKIEESDKEPDNDA